MKVHALNSSYQNNRDWAINNKKRGKYAALSEACSIGLSVAKSFTEEDSLLNKSIDFTQKALDVSRDYNQYSIYLRDDDDVGEDTKNKPFVGEIGKAACFVEKNINPWLIPLSFLVGEKAKEGYTSIAHYLNSLYWWQVPRILDK